MSFIKKTLDFNDVDYMGNYKLTSLFSTLAALATINGAEIGLWNDGMRKQYGWVVAKQTMKLEEPIRVDDTIEISTAVDKGTMVTFPRNYYIRKDGRLVGTIASVWTLLDLEKRSIVAPKRIGLTVPDIKCDLPLDAPKAIKEDMEMELVSQRKVMYSDLDVNQHMNNARYLEWACDLVALDMFESKYIKELSIHYRKEIKPGALVDLFLGKNDDKYIIKGIAENEMAFILEMVFDNR